MRSTFDIKLVDAIDKLQLNKEEIAKLGTMTQRREIASARYGHVVMYREATLRRLFNR